MCAGDKLRRVLEGPRAFVHAYDLLPVADIGARTTAAGTGDLRARATEQEQDPVMTIRKAPFISNAFG